MASKAIVERRQTPTGRLARASWEHERDAERSVDRRGILRTEAGADGKTRNTGWRTRLDSTSEQVERVVWLASTEVLVREASSYSAKSYGSCSPWMYAANSSVRVAR